jgi:hypothetical protein
MLDRSVVPASHRRGQLADAPSLLFRWLAVLSSVLFAFAPAIAAAQSVPAGTNQIITDGRTATAVTTNGSVTNITTTTTAGANAFNSFSQFKLGAGNTANLQLPTNTGNLVNLVHDGPVVINGILNSYKNGQIGGNVYFADPYGFVVGRSGVINTGALTVATPTKSFMDSLISPSGQIGAGATQQLIDGNVPLSPDGAIAIRGRINAADGVRLIGQSVAIGPGQEKRNANIAQAAKFAATVNSKGLRNSSGIVVRNGAIQIVAGGDARINGRLSARSQGNPNSISVSAGNNVALGAKAQLSANSKTGNAGNISVKAANDIAIAANAGLSARSRDGKGGNIVVFADGNTTVASDARINVSSAQSDAGFVELSAKNTVTLGIIKLDLSAPNGKAGTLLIDPYDLQIVGGPNAREESGGSDTYTVANSIYSKGGNVTLTATNSITIAAGGVIDTRQFAGVDTGGVLSLANASTGNSGSVTLTAPQITIAGKILTNVINAGGSSWSAGDVALNATATQTVANSSHTADAKITVSGEINAGIANANGAARAGDISLLATATSTNFSGEVIANAEISISGGRLTGRDVNVVTRSIATSSFLEGAPGTMALIGETLAGSFLGINGGYVAGTTSAKVTVDGSAQINATRDVTLTSHATETAANPAMSLFGLAGSPLGASAVVGAITATVQTKIDSSVTIHTGRDLAISAKNEANVAVSALVGTTAGIVDATVAYSKVRVNTSVDVASGADISAAKVTVFGLNTNSFSTSSTVFAVGAGSVGGAVAYSDVSTSVTANFGASLGTSGAPIPGSLSIEAFSNTLKMVTSASTQVGNNAIANALMGIDHAAVQERVGTLVTPLFGSELGVKGGAALALTSSNQVAQASIDGGSGTAPSIYAGDVSVISRVIDSAIRNNAGADVAASNTSQSAPTIMVSTGIAYGTYRHESTAFIGHGVSVSGRNIGVSATTELPNENTWVQNWTTDSVGDVLSHLNGNAGTVNNILTSYANTTASGSQNLSAAGSVNFFAVTNNTTAWVATDAHLTQSNPTHAGACSNSTWCTQQSNGDFLDWNAPISVTATTKTRSIDIAGNFGIFSLTGTGSDGSGVGGSLNLVFYNNTTIAGIAQGATVASDTQVAVSAWTNDVFFALAPTSGVAAGSLLLNGIASYAGIHNTTHASISNLASISAPTISIKATENLQLMSLSGAVTSGGTAGVGLSAAALDVQSDTKAYIGTNDTDRPAVAAQSSFSNVGSHFNADNLTVYAVTTGQATVASIAAAESDPASEGKTFAGKITSALSNAATFADPGYFNQAVGDAQNAGKTATQNVTSRQPPSFSIDIAGSTSATVMRLGTTATVNGATIDRFTQPSGQATSPRVNVDVEALNNTFVNAGSGAAALNFQANPNTTAVAVAGSMAIGVMQNATTAALTSSSVSNAGDVTVRALASGEQTLVGLGVAVAASAGQNSAAASVSGSVGLVTDSVNASIGNSNITGVSGGSSRDVVVQAYQTTDIGIGAGALYAGVKGGVGISITYVSIGDPSGRHAADAHLSSTTVTSADTLTISAVDAARISSGAATAGGQASTDGTGLTGAIVINAITPTISAAILDNQANNQIDPIRLTGNLVVTASGTRNATLDAKIANDSIGVDGAAAAHGSGTYDFAGTGIVSGGTSGGAAIVAIAGQIQLNGNNFGAAVVSNVIAQTYIAQIGTSDIDTGSGDVFVTASDTSKIIAVAVGLAISSGQYAGTGSLVINQVNDSVNAQIGGTGASTTNTIVKGRNIAIAAANAGSIEAAAGTATFAPQATAFGIASVTNTVGNTIAAAIDGGTLAATKSIVVSGGSTVGIQAIALGGAWGQNFGAAGSLAVNLLSTNVTARITSGADVTADNNVGVLAANSDTIRVIAGAAAASTGSSALGASVVVNTISGTTQAYVSDSGTKVDAKGADLTDDLLVNKGQLVHAIDVGTASRPSDTAPDLTEMQQTVNGLAIVASSHQAVVTNALSAGLASSVGAGLTPVTNLMGGTTKAYVADAAIDTRLTAGGNAPQIELLASSFSYAGNFALGSALAGSNAGGAAAVGMRMDRKTYATVTNTTIGTVAVQTDTTSSNGTSIITKTYVPVAGAMRVRAVAEQDASNIVTAGGAGGSAGLAASGAVTLYNADTQAYVTGSRVTAQSLAVTASSTNGLFAATGAGAMGGAAGVGTAFDVTIANNNTLAYVGAANVTTMVNLTGGLTIQANSANTFNTYAVGGADGGSAGIAGMANVTTVANTTVAGLYNTYVNKQPPTLSGGVAGTDGSGNPTSTFDYTSLANNPDKLLSTPAAGVAVNAHEDINVFQMTGALGNGVTAGIGAGVSVVIIKSGVTGEIADSDIVSNGTVAVSATSARSVEAWEVTAGAGLTAGIGAAVGIIIIGNNSTDPNSQADQNAQAGGTVTAANSFAASSNISAPSASLGGGADGITARITRGTIAAQAVNVSAAGQVETKSHVLGAGFAMTAGVGAAVGYTSVTTAVQASVSPVLLMTDNLTMSATMGDHGSGHAVDQDAVAGGGALVAALGAAVSVATLNNSVSTTIGGVVNANTISGTASDSTSARATTGGGGGAILAIGASVSQATKSSHVDATIADWASIVGGITTLNASESGAVFAQATASTGGVFAGNGASAKAFDNGTVNALIGSNADVSYNTLTLAATAAPEVQAYALGVVAGGIGVGASIAQAKGNTAVTTGISDNAVLWSSGGAIITAKVMAPTSGTSARADSIAGSGGMLVGVAATVSNAEIDADVTAYIGKNVTLRGGYQLTADNTSVQWASTTGIVAGTAAVGSNEAHAISHGTTRTYVDDGAITDPSRTGGLTVVATGTKFNTATATSGSGGMVSGAAGSASTFDDVSTVAEILNSSAALRRLYGGDFIFTAYHGSTFTSQVNATQASAVGYSGAFVQNTVNTPVTVNIGGGLRLNSLGDIKITATNAASNNNSYANGGGGGAVNGQTVKVITSVTNPTTVNVGNATWLSVNGDPMGQHGILSIEVANSYFERSWVQLAAGGAFEGGGATDRLGTNITNTINVGANAVLFSVGQIQIGTVAAADVLGRARSQIWGVIGSAGAETDLHYDVTQAVTIAANARLEAYDLITVSAGQSGQGPTGAVVQVYSFTDVYNNTLIPITVLARGTAAASNTSTLSIANGAQVLGVGNVSLGAYDSTQVLDGKGTGHNPYLTLFSKTDHDDNNEGSNASNIVNNGAVKAGIHSQLGFAFDESGAVTRLDSSGNPLVLIDRSLLNSTYITAEQNRLYYAIAQINPRAEAQARIDQLQAQLAAATTQFDRDRISAQLTPLLASISAMPSSAVDAIFFGNLFASGGDITVHSGSLTGTGTLVANGAASITVNNDSPKYLVMSDITIGSTQGGNLQFSGGAVAPVGMAAYGNTSTAPQITLNATYKSDRAITDPLPNPPAIVLQGAVKNLNGNVAVFNKFGDLSIYSSLDAASLNINLPNGRLVVDTGGFFSTGGAAQGILANYMTRPLTINEMIYYAANYEYNRNGQFTDAAAFSAWLYEHAGSTNGTLAGIYYLGKPNGTSNYCITSPNCSGLATPHLPSTSLDVIPIRSLSFSGDYDVNRLNAGTPVIRAGQVYISANIIDVNGPIIAGRIDNWSINMDAATATEIASFRSQYAQGHGTVFDITTATKSASGDNLIGARYDAVNNQILLSDIANSVAGYVYLNGKIVNSTMLGNITVNAGYSNVTVNNNTGVAIATGKISAGQATPGVVQIVDRNIVAPGPGVDSSVARTRWYVYTPGSATPLAIYTAEGGSINDYRLATQVGSATASSTASYAPRANSTLNWSDWTYLIRTNSGSGPTWEFDSENITRTDNPYLVANSTVGTATAGQRYFSETVIAGSQWLTASTSVGCGSNCTIPYNYQYAIYLTVAFQYSVRADAPIGISFNSNGIGSVSVNSNNVVTVGSSIDNARGTTTIAAPRIYQGDSGLVGGDSIVLSTSDGIGTNTKALSVSLGSGTLTASSTYGSIYASANGGLRLSSVTAGRDVNLTATNDIVAAGAMNLSGAPVVSGRNITLTTTGGAIGANTTTSGGNPTPTNIQPLVLQADGVINASGTTAVYLVQKNGDFRIGNVASNGAVFLMAAGVDGQPANLVNGIVPTVDTAEQARQAQVWADLNLTGNDGTGAVQQYEAVVNRNYQEYLQFNRLVTMANGTSATDRSAALSVIKAQLAALTGTAVGSISDTAALTYAQGRIATLRAYLTPTSFDATNPTTAFVTAQLTVAMASLDQTFHYTLPTNSAVYANLISGSQWTLNQLTTSINSSAVSGGVSQTVSQLPININGRQVMLYAPNGSIGSRDPNLNVTFTTADLSALTPEVKTKLMLAGPGDLTVQQTALSGGVTQYAIAIAQTNLVVSSALGPISAKAKNNIYIGGTGDMLLGGALASLFPTLPSNYAPQASGVVTTDGGDVRIDAGRSIVNNAPGQTVISGNVSLLNLIAETGRIGTAGTGNPNANPNAIIASLTGGGVFDSGRAANGIYFRQAAGDLIVGNLYGGNSTNGVMQLSSSGSIYAEPQFTDRTVPHILGKSLDLRADNGDIGTNGGSYQPLQVSLTGGALTGNALGDFAVLSPTASLTVGTADALGGVTAGGILTLSATGGDLTVTRSLVGLGNLSLTANGTLTIAAGTPSSPVTVSSTSGSVSILAGVLAMQADTSVAAATDINIITTGALTATALTSATGNIFASAVGDASVTSASITASTGSQTITLKSTGGALHVASISGPGAIELDASATLTVNQNGQVTSRGTITIAAGALAMQSGSQLSAATGIHIETTGALTAQTLTTTTGDIFASAGGDAAFTTAIVTATTGNDAITLKSTGGALSLDSAATQGTVTLEAAGIATLNATGQVTSRARNIAITAGALDMQTGSQLSAATGIVIQTAGALSAKALTTTTGDIVATAGGDAAFTTANVTATSGGDAITLKSTGGALSLDSAAAQGTITLGAAGTATLNPNGQVTSRGRDVAITAGALDMQSGSQLSAATGIIIQTAGALTAKTLTTTTGDIVATAGGDASFTTANVTATTGSDAITLKSTGGALSLDSAAAQGRVTLEAAGTATLNPNGQVTSRGRNIAVTAGVLDMKAGSQLTAATGIAIQTTGNLAAESLTTATGDIAVRSGANGSVTAATISDANAGDITFDTAGALGVGTASAAGTIRATAGGTMTVANGGQVASRNSNITFVAGSLRMDAGSSVTAAGRIGITTIGDAILGRLASQLDPGPSGAPVITIGAGTAAVAGAILGNGDGQINLTTVRPNASVLLTATNGIGTDARPLQVDVPVLSGTTSHGGIYIDATGTIRFPVLSTPSGETKLNTGGDLVLDKVSGENVRLSSAGDLNIGTITATKSVNVTANTFTATIVQDPGAPTPLVVNVTGANGGVAEKVVIAVDAPAGVTFNQLSATDAQVTTTGSKVAIVNGYVPGKLTLDTASQDIVLDNRSPVPTSGADVQLYGPGGSFTLVQNNNVIVTSSYVVGYGVNAAVTALGSFAGMSFIRDFPRDTRNGDVTVTEVKKDGKTVYVIGLSPAALFDAGALPKPVETIGSGPAVNLDGLQ